MAGHGSELMYEWKVEDVAMTLDSQRGLPTIWTTTTSDSMDNVWAEQSNIIRHRNYFVKY